MLETLRISFERQCVTTPQHGHGELQIHRPVPRTCACVDDCNKCSSSGACDDANIAKRSSSATDAVPAPIRFKRLIEVP